MRISFRYQTFWNEQWKNAEDYNSLDIHYSNGAYIKFLVYPTEYMGMPIAACRLAYADCERTMETGGFAPIKHKVEYFVNKTLDVFDNNSIDYIGGIERIYENVLEDTLT